MNSELDQLHDSLDLAAVFLLSKGTCLDVSKNRGIWPPKMDGKNFMVPNPYEQMDGIWVVNSPYIWFFPPVYHISLDPTAINHPPRSWFNDLSGVHPKNLNRLVTFTEEHVAITSIFFNKFLELLNLLYDFLKKREAKHRCFSYHLSHSSFCFVLQFLTSAIGWMLRSAQSSSQQRRFLCEAAAFDLYGYTMIYMSIYIM